VLPPRLANLPVAARCAGLAIFEATSPKARLLGLALLREPPPDVALHFPRCRSVHTFGMRFPIDIAFLDENGETIRTDRAVPPNRVRTCRAARAVLEKPTGAAP
jgi:uncharacterized protein